jgi:hypothetical protein
MLVAMNLRPPYELVQQVGMSGPVTAVCWHPRINQIIVGTGEQSKGEESKGWAHVLYNPDMSEKGALLCAGKKPREANPFDYQPPLVIHNPGALPMFRDNSWRKRRREPDGGVCYHSPLWAAYLSKQKLAAIAMMFTFRALLRWFEIWKQACWFFLLSMRLVWSHAKNFCRITIACTSFGGT